MQDEIKPLRIHTLPSSNKYHTTVDVLRLDELHPVVSGNKWFKLRGYLAEAQAAGASALLTFGGAWSNHILATAAACRKAGLQSIGIIRGEEPAVWSSTLLDAKAWGMALYFSSRESYREGEVPPSVWERYEQPTVFSVPEGGYGLDGAACVAGILDAFPSSQYTQIVAAAGTGTTLAGLVLGAKDNQVVTGISVLKNHRGLDQAVAALLPEEKKEGFRILHDFHFGGYARHTPELLSFMNDWYRRSGIPSDFVYTGKLFYAADQMLMQGYFRPEDRLLLIHSGGLQGNRSLPKGTLIFEPN